jgi:hypothetical protein
MSTQFTVSDVSSEFIMDVAKTVASSPHPLRKEDLMRCFKKSPAYVSNAISQSLQLGLIEMQGGFYVGSEKYRDLVKRSDKSQLYLPLRKALQAYPPFLLYVDFVSKGYASTEASNMTQGIFRIQNPERIVEKSFRTWGTYAGLIAKDASGALTIPEAEKGMTSEYVASLMRALRAELQASVFLIETMSQQAFVYMTEKGIGIEDLSDALINYENDAKISANKTCQTFVHFLFKFGEDVDAIRGQNQILKNQLHICHGIGGIRNMSHHDPDKETGKPWNFTPQGAIIASLIVPSAIRSIYLYWKEKKQEF